ncbi:MAG: arylsulfatase [Verrucomicrobia bacterium]|nr:arylsulfatase [Verrucomicrobiota bacterium]
MRLLLSLLLPLALCAADARKPNILVILADDLGYGDVRAYNPSRGKIPTPHLDKLAAEGMRFTDGHSSSGVCSPSRYALLTGRYHWRTRLQTGIVGVFGEPLIAPGRLTVAGLAKQHGYRTAAIGKWHLGWDWPISQDEARLFRGTREASAEPATEAHRAAWTKAFTQPIPGGPTTRGFDAYFGTDVPNWPPYCFIENDRTVGAPCVFLPKELFRNHLASLPGPALPEWKLEGILPALTERACRFITESSARKEPFLLYLPLTTPHTPLAVNAEWQGRSGLNNAAADLIMETDAAVGKVLAALEASGAAKDTVVLFTSDNGFAAYVGAKDLEKQGHFPSGPLRDYKTSVHEGGHRVPFIVRWPGTVKPGSTCDRLVHQADLIATVAEMLQAKLPENAAEDSFSFLPLLKGSSAPTRDHAISCASAGTPGLRLGRWKYIPTQPAQLYDLDADLGETKNLAAAMPEKVAEMKALLEKLIADGRSTPGEPQKNDVEVIRFPKAGATKAKAAKKAK